MLVTFLPAANHPLCVDLDGTLIKTDLLIESAFALLRLNVLYLFLFPYWLFSGKAHLKHEIARRVDIDVSLLPYNSALVEYLTEQHSQGRPLILATASNQKFAHAVAQYLGLFDRVLASDEQTNLSGHRKRDQLLADYGDNGFAYAGNARIDLEIWSHADEGIIVDATSSVTQAAETLTRVSATFASTKLYSPLSRYLKAMRIHQWPKNVLVFVPLVAAHQFSDGDAVQAAIIAFFSFGLCASSVYLLNDLVDLPSDRAHPRKCNRPFACGEIPLIHGALIAPVLLIASFALALLLPPDYLLVLSLYYVATMAYSFRLKQAALIDIMLLGWLYTLRIIAGAAAEDIEPSFWLLAFSMFLFISLALVKRYTEVRTMIALGKTDIAGRGYRSSDLHLLSQFGSASSYMAILVLALYINSENISAMYQRPELIWILCPLMLYMITRIWLLAHRDEIDEDPVVFIMSDRRSQGLMLLGAILMWFAI
ncbi:MAG TPA: UbiA family prenyltransferase [Chromatiaceae bacterium]|nr:UbiA family prenyltransferase [Chromatiaceae bacterium]HIN81786.1 UbiA family prenyltransferase [Chromatiales bacterium]